MTQVTIEVRGIANAVDTYKEAMIKIAERVSWRLAPRFALMVEASAKYRKTEYAVLYYLRKLKKIKRREVYLRRCRWRGERMKKQ